MTLTAAPRNVGCVSFALLVNHKWLLSDQALAFSLFCSAVIYHMPLSALL